MKTSISTTLAAVALALAFWGCGKAPAQDAGQPPAAEQRENAAGPARLAVSAQSQKESGIITEVLKRAAVPETFQAMGRVLQDAQKTRHITAGGGGALETLNAGLGQMVKAGDTMAVIRTDARETLKVVSKYSGLVTAVHAGEGDPVNEMTFLFTVTEVDPLWGVLDIHERNLAQVRQGQKAELRAAAYPDSVFSGKVAFVSPEIDPVSRTVKARVSIENPAGLLKFGMFLDAAVFTGTYFQGLAAPAAAVQHGPEGPFVFVKTGEEEFTPRPVTTGKEKGALVEIKSGLKPGDRVVVEGSYLLKSEMMKGEMDSE